MGHIDQRLLIQCGDVYVKVSELFKGLGDAIKGLTRIPSLKCLKETETRIDFAYCGKFHTLMLLFGGDKGIARVELAIRDQWDERKFGERYAFPIAAEINPGAPEVAKSVFWSEDGQFGGPTDEQVILRLLTMAADAGRG